MSKNKDPSDFLFNSQRKSRLFEPDEELLKLEQELRQRNLLYTNEVQSLMKIATGFNNNSQWARDELRMILESDRIMDMRTGDVFRPMAPPQLLSQGNLHLLNQLDDTPWKIPLNALTRGMFLTGPQGGGKTRFLISICKQLDNADTPFFILDTKQGLKEWAGYLNATYINLDEISIDLSPPHGLTYEQWLPSLMPQLGDLIGIIYGVEILQQASQICIGQRQEYIKRTGKDTEISLKDLYLALPFVQGASSGRRSGYKDAVSTGLSRILTGSGNLFKCRKGVDLSSLFNRNIILGCRSITDDFAAKFLALYLLYWLYESERFSLPSDTLKRTMIIEDATQYLSIRKGFDATSSTSSFTNIFSRLRSSGNGVICTSQVPHLADPGILALSHTVICVGGLHHSDDTKLLAQMMGLNNEQRIAITRFAKREAVGICAGSAWPKPVHGITPEVADL